MDLDEHPAAATPLERLAGERERLAGAIEALLGATPLPDPFEADVVRVCAPSLRAVASALADPRRLVDVASLAAVEAFIDPAAASPLVRADRLEALLAAADLERRVYGVARPRTAPLAPRPACG